MVHQQIHQIHEQGFFKFNPVDFHGFKTVRRVQPILVRYPVISSKGA